MLRHAGHHRTYLHNLRLASMLCLTAGFVNVAGFLAFSVLTTNVTGHVAIFAEKLSMGDFSTARVIGLWMFMFWFGAFLSSLIITFTRGHTHLSYAIPVIMEILILLMVAGYGYRIHLCTSGPQFLAGSLLFAMGMQNALVSVVSGSVVRTTHLTGMFTDLGIELAALVRGRWPVQRDLKNKISLHLAIIFFFFLGGISGGYLFQSLHYHTFYIPAGILITVLFYDLLRIRVIRCFRHIVS